MLRGGAAKLALVRAVVELVLAHTMELRTGAARGAGRPWRVEMLVDLRDFYQAGKKRKKTK